MAITGLVVTFGDDPGQQKDALEAIGRAGPFTAGDQHGNRLALALETTDDQEAHTWHDWLRGLPGVLAVDLAFVYFDTDHESGEAHGHAQRPESA